MLHQFKIVNTGLDGSKVMILTRRIRNVKEGHKRFEDAELEELLDQDSCQTQEELAEILKVTQQAISLRLKDILMIQNEEILVQYELICMLPET